MHVMKVCVVGRNAFYRMRKSFFFRGYLRHYAAASEDVPSESSIVNVGRYTVFFRRGHSCKNGYLGETLYELVCLIAPQGARPR